jgi:hypothetical protein
MYIKCFFASGGDITMSYMWLPVACDVPITPSTLETIKACYDQHVRWMCVGSCGGRMVQPDLIRMACRYGSLDIGFFFVRCFLSVPGSPGVPLRRKVRPSQESADSNGLAATAFSMMLCADSRMSSQSRLTRRAAGVPVPHDVGVSPALPGHVDHHHQLHQLRRPRRPAGAPWRPSARSCGRGWSGQPATLKPDSAAVLPVRTAAVDIDGTDHDNGPMHP